MTISVVDGEHKTHYKWHMTQSQKHINVHPKRKGKILIEHHMIVADWLQTISLRKHGNWKLENVYSNLKYEPEWILMLLFILIFIKGIHLMLFKICYQLALKWRNRKAFTLSSGDCKVEYWQCHSHPRPGESNWPCSWSGRDDISFLSIKVTPANRMPKRANSTFPFNVLHCPVI